MKGKHEKKRKRSGKNLFKKLGYRIPSRGEIAEYFKLGELDIPQAAREKSHRFFVIAGIMAATGLLLSVMMRSPSMLVISLFMALLIAGYGWMPMVRVSKNGYLLIEGVCERLETNGSIQDHINPPKFIIRSTGENDEPVYYGVPYFKQNTYIPDNAIVDLYYHKDAFFYKSKGINTSADLIGYEIVGMEDDYDYEE